MYLPLFKCLFVIVVSVMYRIVYADFYLNFILFCWSIYVI